ncbi:helix-turn-helix domain-containing protein [Sulfitobacter sp. F26204]|uniref:helix-turn-helix domain-containing protein n=1 Tax=Sulfitobacter sp. F26204 TaxID=2996014 RepID=UPI00225E2B39|nr:helix-turn-helix domain-containing protein [Sulfitobacter sp. F26204]MCX7561613.1 helix-turn-helix domain-containing protein [Sulfitobacter sp. F26204]
MPDILETDPKKGFVALPASVFDLDLSPGAFRTLAELCRMANLEGQCWPSLAQLGKRLGRSRAAVSGYIAELRDASLIETETQKMANGYNYRLRYCVIFWKSWRKQLSQSSERSVKPVERPLRTKNQSHKNQSPVDEISGELVPSWKDLVGRAPYPSFERWPSETLLATTRDRVATGKTDISADIIPAFEAFLHEKGIKPQSLCIEARRTLRSGLIYEHQVTHFISIMNNLWKPHWAKPPSATQLQRILKELPARNGPEAECKLLASYLKRWKTYSSSLSSRPSAAKVAA